MHLRIWILWLTVTTWGTLNPLAPPVVATAQDSIPGNRVVVAEAALPGGGTAVGTTEEGATEDETADFQRVLDRVQH